MMGLPEVDRDEIREYFVAAGMGELYDDLERTL